MATTRLGLYGGARSPYGSFAGKTPEVGGTTLLDFMRGIRRGVMMGVARGMH